MHPGGADTMRRVAMLSYDVLRLRQSAEVWGRLTEYAASLLDASLIRGFDLDDGGAASLVVEHGRVVPSEAALLMEAALIDRAVRRERSLISNHPALDHDLAGLAHVLGCEGSVVHAFLLRADRRTHGVMAAHWIGTPRPDFERRAGFYIFGENAALALGIARERESLQRTAFVDALTSLPNQRALEAALARHADTHPLGVLVLDFDGMRAANAAFENDYARGGDVLIVAVAHALRTFAGAADVAARMHTRGDEFCLIMPGCDEAATTRRCQELQQLLDGLAVPESHRHVYRGASVGGASRAAGEPVAETLARASRAMHERKRATRSR